MAEFEENPDVTSCAAQIPMRISNHLFDYIGRLQERGLAGSDYDVRTATAFLMGALFSDAMSRDIAPARFPYSLDEAAERYVMLFARAIGVKQSVQSNGHGTKGKR